MRSLIRPLAIAAVRPAPLVALSAACALLLSLGAGAAQEPATARLHPGLNELIWLGSPESPADLFEEAPRLEAVWLWDADAAIWRGAARDVPESLWTLSRITPYASVALHFAAGVGITWPPAWLIGSHLGIHGRLLDHAGRGLPSALFTATNSETGQLFEVSDSAGAFRITVPVNGEYKIRIERLEGCTLYVTSDGVSADARYAVPVRVESNIIHRDIIIPEGTCERKISGTILDLDGNTVDGVRVGISKAEGAQLSVSTAPDADGSYTLDVPERGTYRMFLSWRSRQCSVSVSSDGITILQEQRDLIHIDSEDIQRHIRIPAGTCKYAIAVRIIFLPDGILNLHDKVGVCLPIGGTKHCFMLPWRSELSAWHLIVPIEGEYELLLRDEGRVRYRTLGRDDLAPIPVFGGDATVIIFVELTSAAETAGE